MCYLPQFVGCKFRVYTQPGLFYVQAEWQERRNAEFRRCSGTVRIDFRFRFGVTLIGRAVLSFAFTPLASVG